MRDHSIVVIGATGKLGQAVCNKLSRAGLSFQVVGRNKDLLKSLYPDTPHYVADNNDTTTLITAMKGCDVVVNCSHSRFTKNLLEAMPSDAHIIIMGSTRRYSRFPDTYAKQVTQANNLLKTSRKSWVLLDPTMIYGPHGEANVQVIANYIRKLGVIPITQNGKALIQPIFADDLAECICYLAQHKEINGKAITVAGPKAVSYKEFIQLIADANGYRVRFLNLPVWVLRLLAYVTHILPGVPAIEQSQIQRQLEDKNFDIQEMLHTFPTPQTSLEEGLRQTFSK